MGILLFIASSTLSYWFFKIMTHPNSSAKKRLPTFKLKSFQLLPNIEIHVKGRIVHVHHWMALSVVLIISVIVDQRFLDALYTRGFLVGGIYQGFTFPDWKQILFKKTP